MPAERTAMRQVREIVRMRAAGISSREIGVRLGIAPSTEATQRGFVFQCTDEAALEARLFSQVGTKQGHRRHAEPDFGLIHRELKRKHVTLQILWDEYIDAHPDG